MELPSTLLNVGGSCTRVSRPVNRKTSAPEGAPRTATINADVNRVPIEVRLLNPVTELAVTDRRLATDSSRHKAAGIVSETSRNLKRHDLLALYEP